jgi:hypothetical protein
MTRNDMDNETFDISGYATGIIPTTSVLNAATIAKLKVKSNEINGTDTKVYISVRNSITDTYKDKYTLQSISEYVNIRPNIIEYKVPIDKEIIKVSRLIRQKPSPYVMLVKCP